MPNKSLDRTIALVFGFIAGAIIVALYPRWHQTSLENGLRQVADEIMASPGPYICEVEPRGEGLWLRQMDKQIVYEWKSLEALEETADSVDIFSRDGGGVIVRNRAFGSESDRAKFVELVRSSLAESQLTRAWSGLAGDWRLFVVAWASRSSQALDGSRILWSV